MRRLVGVVRKTIQQVRAKDIALDFEHPDVDDMLFGNIGRMKAASPTKLGMHQLVLEVYRLNLAWGIAPELMGEFDVFLRAARAATLTNHDQRGWSIDDEDYKRLVRNGGLKRNRSH